MKAKKLIVATLVMSAAGGLSSCGDDGKTSAPTPPAKAVKESAAELPQGGGADVPAEAEIREQLLPLLADYPAIRVVQVQADATPAEDGRSQVAVRVRVCAGENLYVREEAPEVFNEERRAANESMNRAMMPEAHYLLLAGAASEEISDADREARALPPELQQLAAEMKAMAESPIYRLRMPANAEVDLAATLMASRSEGRWVFSEVRFDTAPLRELVACVTESAMPQDAAVVNEGFENRRRLALRKKVEAFEQAAAPHVQAREDAARKRMLEQRSRAEEAAKAGAELAAQKAAAREQWDKLMAGSLKSGALFVGEWSRGDSFGQLSLRIAKVQSFADSVQFTGELSDPSLPQVSLQVVGRMEMPASADAPVPMVVHIYSGRYEPDIPTAEVFDAQDAMLKLNMKQDGAAQGTLTCSAWKDTPEKDFRVSLALSVRKPIPAPTRAKQPRVWQPKPQVPVKPKR